jgi:hypothetical protein
VSPPLFLKGGKPRCCCSGCAGCFASVLRRHFKDRAATIRAIADRDAAKQGRSKEISVLIARQLTDRKLAIGNGSYKGVDGGFGPFADNRRRQLVDSSSAGPNDTVRAAAEGYAVQVSVRVKGDTAEWATPSPSPVKR